MEKRYERCPGCGEQAVVVDRAPSGAIDKHCMMSGCGWELHLGPGGRPEDEELLRLELEWAVHEMGIAP